MKRRASPVPGMAGVAPADAGVSRASFAAVRHRHVFTLASAAVEPTNKGPEPRKQRSERGTPTRKHPTSASKAKQRTADTPATEEHLTHYSAGTGHLPRRDHVWRMPPAFSVTASWPMQNRQALTFDLAWQGLIARAICRTDKLLDRKVSVGAPNLLAAGLNCPLDQAPRVAVSRLSTKARHFEFRRHITFRVEPKSHFPLRH